MSVPRDLLRRRRDGRFEWKLGANERTVLGQVASEFKDLLAHETPSSDASLQRVFPPAHPDDPIAELEYERASGGSLLATKIEQLETFERCVGERTLSENEVLACMRAANDLRLRQPDGEVRGDSSSAPGSRSPRRRPPRTSSATPRPSRRSSSTRTSVGWWSR